MAGALTNVLLLSGCRANTPRRGQPHPTSWAFAQRAEGQAQVAQIFAELSRDPISKAAFRIGTLSFPGKEVVSLQAADSLAHEVLKQGENQVVDRSAKRGVRLSV